MGLSETAIVWIILLTSLDGIVCQQVNLTPETIVAEENNTIQLQCKYTGTETVSKFLMVFGVGAGEDGELRYVTYKWTINVTSVVQAIGKTADNMYEFIRFGNTLMFWTIKNIDRSSDGKWWTCAVSVPSTEGFVFSNDVSVTVRAPPDGPPTIDGYTNGGTYRMTENQVGSLKCSSTGGNPLATLSWSCYSGQTTNDGTTNITVVSTRTWTAVRNTDRICTCTSSQILAGQQTVTVNVQVLYGPSVSSMSNQGVEEGGAFRYKCLYTPGKPTETTVTWSIADYNKVWISEWLKMINVSRRDATKYICTVQNIMEPTYMPLVTDPKSGYFYLDVKYKASIAAFYVEGHGSFRHDVTVKEFTSPELVCNVDGNPDSNIKLLFQNKTLEEGLLSNIQLRHQLSNVSCDDIGIYTCTGSNYLNTEPSTQDVTLLVNCRPQPYGYIEHTVYTAQYDMATINLSILAYPAPLSVVWKKDGANLTNSEKITTTMTPLKTSESYIDTIQLHLIVHNVTLADLGEYKVYIHNDVGLMEESFYLRVEEIEEPPGIVGVVGGVVIGVTVVGSVVLVIIVTAFRRRRHSSTGRACGATQISVQYTGSDDRRHSVQNASTDTF